MARQKHQGSTVPYAENSALRLFLNIPFLNFLSLFRNCFGWMVCSQISSGAGLTGWFALKSHLEQVWDLCGTVQVSQETAEKIPLNILILANISRARKRSFYSCQLTKHSFYPSLLGNLLIRPSLERTVDSLWAAGSFT